MGALVLTRCHEGAESSHSDEASKGDVQVSWSAADAAIKALYRALTRAHNLTSRRLIAVQTTLTWWVVVRLDAHHQEKPTCLAKLLYAKTRLTRFS